jgi:hypothetical protein
VVIFLLSCFLFYQIIFLKRDWVFIDNINLAFHEAGHLFLSWDGETLHFLGGTIGQLFFPALIAVIFFVKGERFAGCMVSFWFFENGINIARYCEDAITMELPLVGGGTHDWNWLLTRFNKIQYCYDYAKSIRTAGKIGMSVSLILGLFFLIWSFRKNDEEYILE